MELKDKITSYRILIWSENPDELQKFYRDALELEPFIKIDIPDDYGYAFKVGDTGLLIWIGKHSEVQGINKEPYRHMFNLYVNDVPAWIEKVRKVEGVKIIQEPMVTPPTRDQEVKKYVATFLDPEGNCFQFMNP